MENTSYDEMMESLGGKVPPYYHKYVICMIQYEDKISAQKVF